jgi:acetyltransferase
VALPPLNETIIRGMIGRTRVARLLKRFRHMPPVDVAAPRAGAAAHLRDGLRTPRNHRIGHQSVDRRRERPCSGGRAHRRRPAQEFGPSLRAHGDPPLPGPPGRGMADARRHHADSAPDPPRGRQDRTGLRSQTSPTSRSYFRFMQAVHELTPEMLVRFTQIDYDREMALIAVVEADSGPGDFRSPWPATPRTRISAAASSRSWSRTTGRGAASART